MGFQLILIRGVNLFFEFLYFVILARIILSWLPIGRGSAISNLLYSLTEPILGPIRAMIDKSPLGGGMMLDFSPIIALFIMNLVKMLIISLLSSI